MLNGFKCLRDVWVHLATGLRCIRIRGICRFWSGATTDRPHPLHGRVACSRSNQSYFGQRSYSYNFECAVRRLFVAVQAPNSMEIKLGRFSTSAVDIDTRPAVLNRSSWGQRCQHKTHLEDTTISSCMMQRPSKLVASAAGSGLSGRATKLAAKHLAMRLA